jgi:steroid 5-alpha reductase family enzyme
MGLSLNQISASLPAALLLLWGLALLITVIGFHRVVYFVSTGYAFSITAMAVLTTLLLRQSLTWASLLQNLLLIVWGLRLGIYLVRREFQPSYRKELQSVHERGAGLTGGRKVLVWVGVSLLYVAMFSPSLFGLTMVPVAPPALTLITQALGALLMIGGLALEALADKQKSAFKARQPGRFCNTGLYRRVRCPNYLGEITFWLGNWVMGLTFYLSPTMWLMSLIGFVCIVLIMIGSTKRLERAQNQRYGQQPDFQAYSHTVPILFPFVPIYTLQNVRVYLE